MRIFAALAARFSVFLISFLPLVRHWRRRIRIAR
jgi:hypothetical protein